MIYISLGIFFFLIAVGVVCYLWSNWYDLTSSTIITDDIEDWV